MASRPAAVYRLHDTDGQLLYVGVTYDFDARFRAHSKVKSWWPQVAHRDVIWFMDRPTALYEEARAIADEGPLYNERPGVGPLGATVIKRYQLFPWGAPRPVGRFLVNKMDISEVIEETRRGNTHLEVSFEGVPVGIGVPLKWYVAACERMGLPVDLAAMPTVDVDPYL